MRISRCKLHPIPNGLTIKIIKTNRCGKYFESIYGFSYRYGETLSDSVLKNKCIELFYRNLFGTQPFYKRFFFRKAVKDEVAENEQCKIDNTLDIGCFWDWFDKDGKLKGIHKD